MNVYINNTNFFTVDVSNISAQILFMSTPERAPREVGNAQFSAEHLGIREERQVIVTNHSLLGIIFPVF